MPFDVQLVSRPEEIGVIMHDMVNKYYRDCVTYAQKYGLKDYFDMLRSLPYNMEDGLYQSLSRPLITLSGATPIVACANKSICMGSYLKCKGIPYRYNLVSLNGVDPLHHVYTEGYIGGRWIPLDCTFAFNRIGETENWGRKVVI